MTKVLSEVGGFVVLPVVFQSTISPKEATHYIYLKPHEPRAADETASRSLFLVNIPISTSEIHLRHLFATQLSAGRVEKVHFSENAPQQFGVTIASAKSSKKRKRMTAEELEANLNEYSVPDSLPGRVRASGSTAIVVFVDRSSMELSLKAAKRAIKLSTRIIWGKGLEDKLPSGLERYMASKSLQYPPRSDLLRVVDNFMTAYTAMEEIRSQENARKRQMPDEDGFITVTRGSKGGVLRKDEADELKEKQKVKGQGLEDFYRFQLREKRREKQGELLRRFDEDKKKVVEMRMRRGTMKLES